MNVERINAFRDVCLSYLFKIVPIKRDQFYFTSFRGQYSDSPKPISLLLKERVPNGVFVWEISDKCHEKLPDYIVPVKPWTVKSVWLRSRSRIVVDNYLGWTYGHELEGSFKYLFLKGQKKRGQYNLSIWHGTPLKKISIDTPGNNKKPHDFYSSSDALISNSLYLSNILERITDNKVPVLMTGWPRNDILFNNKSSKDRLFEKLGLPHEKKIVLYAPTFRDSGVDNSGLNQLNSLDLEMLLNNLHIRFGSEWIFVFRVHDSVLKAFEEKKIVSSERLFFGNVGDDMAEYLAITDVLITDYSGSLFDYSVTEKPCFLFCPDLRQYSDVERGFYTDIKSLPYPVCETPNDLYQKILEYDEAGSVSAIKSFRTRIGCIDDGNASQRVSQIILDWIRNT